MTGARNARKLTVVAVANAPRWKKKQQVVVQAAPQQQRKKKKQKKAAGGSGPRPKSRKSMGGDGRMVMCPTIASLPTFRFPVHFRQQTQLVSNVNYGTGATSGQSAIFVFAPWADVIGVQFKQSNSSGVPDGTTAITSTFFTDPFITSLLTPLTTSSSANVPAVRWTDFCVKVTAKDSVMSTAETCMFLKWTQSGVPVVGTITPVDYQSTYLSMTEAINNSGWKVHEIANAHLLGTRCFRAAMIDRTGLELTPVSTGSSAWQSVYGDTSSTSVVGAYSMPWTPLVIQCGAKPGLVPSGTGTGGSVASVTYAIEVIGTIEVAAAANNFVSRLATKQPRGGPNGEYNWFCEQDRVLARGLEAVPSNGMTRSARGPLGI